MVASIIAVVLIFVGYFGDTGDNWVTGFGIAFACLGVRGSVLDFNKKGTLVNVVLVLVGALVFWINLPGEKNINKNTDLVVKKTKPKTTPKPPTAKLVSNFSIPTSRCAKQSDFENKILTNGSSIDIMFCIDSEDLEIQYEVGKGQMAEYINPKITIEYSPKNKSLPKIDIQKLDIPRYKDVPNQKKLEYANAPVLAKSFVLDGFRGTHIARFVSNKELFETTGIDSIILLITGEEGSME